ncbi:hypothetical protein FFLO_02891 [Filobasidium floriforme]|uniref:Uncharacterized protein n=1 Tax=Filobasidium floriforme TaxID=5210 RepID=A0A8K0JLP4_9TREE|nr:hypothetical protein FFLO_02891 [Filobasidium floriforme]
MSNSQEPMDHTFQGDQTASVGTQQYQDWQPSLSFDAGGPPTSLPYVYTTSQTVHDACEGEFQQDIPAGMRHVIDWVAEHNSEPSGQLPDELPWKQGALHHDLGSSYGPTYTQPSTAYPSIKPQSADTGEKTREKLSEKLRGRVFTDAERAQMSANSHNAKRCRWYYRQSRKQLNSVSTMSARLKRPSGPRRRLNARRRG